MVALASTSFETRKKKIRIAFWSERLSPRKGHTTTRFVVEDSILVQFAHESVDGIGIPHLGSSTGGARVGARPAQRAFANIGSSAGIPIQRLGNPVRTALEAGFTPNAAFREQGNHRLGVATLWIVTPPTLQRATLEKHRRADPRAVMDREALDIENDPVIHQTYPLFPTIESSWV
jgi:hypothetical protein